MPQLCCMPRIACKAKQAHLCFHRSPRILVTCRCDASVMDGETGSFGAVAAVEGVRNPICAASALAKDSMVPLSCGRVRPM